MPWLQKSSGCFKTAFVLDTFKSQELSFPVWLCFLTCKLIGCFAKRQDKSCFSFLQFKNALGGNTEDCLAFVNDENHVFCAENWVREGCWRHGV